MKIAVSSTGKDLDAQVDPRFGRCQNLIIVDTDSLEYEVVENSNISAGGGAGIATAQLVVDKGVKAVLTGNCGPNAHQVISAAGLELVTGVSGIVRDAVEGYKAGRYRASSSPSVEAHFGMGGGRRSAMGMGSSAAQSVTKDGQIQELKDHAQHLEQSLEELRRRIAALENQGR